MSIINKIKKSIEDATGCPFVYNIGGEVNRSLDNAESFPCAFAFLLDSANIDGDGVNVRERVSMAVFFVHPTDFDFNAIDNEALIDECRAKAYDWIGALRRDSNLTLERISNTQRCYDYFDVNVTGYAVNVTISEVYGYNTCTKKFI